MNMKLRNARKRALLNQYQLAKKCGMSQAYYSAIERGDIAVKFVYKIKIAGALGLRIKDIFSEDFEDEARN